MSTIKTNQLESVQGYSTFDHAAREIKRYEPSYKCGYCLTNPVEIEDGTCQGCLDDLKELE